MMHKNHSRSILSTGIGRVVPALAALVLGFGAATAHAQVQQQQITDLDNQLLIFAQEESSTPEGPLTKPPTTQPYATDPNVGFVKTPPTIVSAAQTELVYAVYSVLLNNPGGAYSNGTTPTASAIESLVQAALAPISTTVGSKTTEP